MLLGLEMASHPAWLGAGCGIKEGSQGETPPRVLRWHEEVVSWGPRWWVSLVLTASTVE